MPFGTGDTACLNWVEIVFIASGVGLIISSFLVLLYLKNVSLIVTSVVQAGQACQKD